MTERRAACEGYAVARGILGRGCMQPVAKGGANVNSVFPVVWRLNYCRRLEGRRLALHILTAPGRESALAVVPTLSE